MSDLISTTSWGTDGVTIHPLSGGKSKTIDANVNIKVGSWVKINHRKCIGKKYTVEKINRKTYILNDGKGARIKASLGLIESI